MRELLGFRNAGVPHRADPIAIGDSRTFGIDTAAAR